MSIAFTTDTAYLLVKYPILKIRQDEIKPPL